MLYGWKIEKPNEGWITREPIGDEIGRDMLLTDEYGSMAVGWWDGDYWWIGNIQYTTTHIKAWRPILTEPYNERMEA